MLVVLSTTVAAATTTAFGPKQFNRTSGGPNVYTETFQHCGTSPCQIVIVNGNANGSNRVSSATISLNGVQIVGPNELNPRVDKIVKSVTLADANQLTVRLTSSPGSFLTIDVECEASPAALAIGPAGVDITNPNLLLSAFPIINNGTAAAENVTTTAISLTGGTLTVPTLPFNLGTIAAGGSSVLDADFSGAFGPTMSYLLNLKGTYNVGASTFCFDLSSTLTTPPGSPGSRVLGTITVDPNTVNNNNFPPQPPDFDEDETNPARWTVPTAPFVAGIPTPGGTDVTPAPIGDPPEVVFNVNNGADATSGASGNVSTTAEPSGAKGNNVVFATANWIALYSTNNGSTFTQLDPTTVFPNDAVGFCCDQVVQYVQSIDRFVWFLQGNGYRLAVASPSQVSSSGARAWTYWNLTPQLFGQPAGTGFDYPDMSVGNGFLYMSWDAGAGCPTGCTGGFQVARTSLAGLAAGGTITIEFTNPADGGPTWGSHVSQNTGDEVFWAGHNNNSNMRVFSLKENSNTYFWRSVGISTWANNAPTSLTPDNQDWVAKNFNGPSGNSFPKNGVIGATRSSGKVWFAWTAGTDSNFSKPHIEMVTLDPGNSYHKDQQVQIWNGSFAFAYPALATNVCTGEIGLSLEFGGGTHFENHAVGFWGDFLVYQTTDSNVGTTRFGDYVTLRQAPLGPDNAGNLFHAFGYGLNSVPPPGSGTNTDIHYVEFGRPATVCNVIG
jgi:hypothetical protein